MSSGASLLDVTQEPPLWLSGVWGTGLRFHAEAEHRYQDALPGLASLRGPIDAFFDTVLVMAENEAVRDNRLRLLGRIVDRIQGLADLARVTPPDERGA